MGAWGGQQGVMGGAKNVVGRWGEMSGEGAHMGAECGLFADDVLHQRKPGQ